MDGEKQWVSNKQKQVNRNIAKNRFIKDSVMG